MKSIKATVTYVEDNLKVFYYKNKSAFISAIIFAIISHSIVFQNQFTNADSIHLSEFPRELALLEGKWLIPIIESLRGRFFIPWYIGIYVIVLLCLGTILLIDVLEIKKKADQVVLAGFLVAFHGWAYSFPYYDIMISYTLAYTLSVLSIWLTERNKNGWALGAVIIVMMLALYQGFLAVSIGISMIMCLKALLFNESTKAKELLSYAMRFLVCGLLGIVLYLISLQLMPHIILDYPTRELDRIGTIGYLPLSDFPHIIRQTYINYIRFFLPSTTAYTGQYPYSYTPLYVSIIYLVLILITCILTIRKLISMNRWKNPFIMISLLIIGLLLPLGLNITQITASEVLLSPMRLFPFIIVFIVAFILMDSSPWLLKGLVRSFVLVLIIYNIQISATVYYAHHIQYERGYAYAIRMLDRLEVLPDFQGNTPVAIIGSITQSPSSYANFNRSTYNASEVFLGYNGFYLANQTPLQHRDFISRFLGTELTLADSQQVQQVQNSPKFTSMPIWPAFGSVAMIDGIAVIRLNIETSINVTKVDGNLFVIENAIPGIPEDYKWAWYVYLDGNQIDTLWYEEGNSRFYYSFDKTGSYRFRMFVQDQYGEFLFPPVWSDDIEYVIP